MAMTLRRGMCAVILGAGLVGVGAATAPVGADYSEPKKTVESFLAAMQSGDEGATRDALVISPESKETVDLYLKVIFSTTKLQKAALEQFGGSAEKYFGTATDNVLASRMKLVEDAPAKIAGDSAVITIPADEGAKQKGGTIVLTKVGRDWKVDAASLFGLTTMSKEDQARQASLAAKLIPITEQATVDVKAGKYSAAVEAYQDFWQKSLDAMKSVNGTGAGTMPATEPAK